MPTELVDFFSNPAWLDTVLPIALAFLLALLVSRSSRAIAGRILRLNRFSSRRNARLPERDETLRSLLGSFITLFAFVVAIIFTIGQFVAADTLVWFVGLFSAAFGLGARPLVNDYLAGISFIFGNTFNVGEKVEILTVEGVIESVTIGQVELRAPTGELYVIPNGEIRVVRNFSRGRFSAADVTVQVATSDLLRTVELLEALGAEAHYLLPNLLEPWQVISRTGEAGQKAELTIVARARFGKAAEMRPRLLALVQERLAEADIPLVD